MKQNNQESAESCMADNGALSFSVGTDVQGNILVQNMALIPHMLIAGYSGSGKTAFIETMLSIMASSHSPEEVQYIICSSKVSDYLLLKDLPHLIVPVIYDYKYCFGALQWTQIEIFKRLKSFSEVNVKDLEGYNKRSEKHVSHMYFVIDTVKVTSANVHDATVAHELLREDDKVMYGDAAYCSVENHPEVKNDEHLSKIEFRTNKQKPYRKNAWVEGEGTRWLRYMEYQKSRVRCKVEFAFHIVKDIFGFRKTRYRGLKKLEGAVSK